MRDGDQLIARLEGEDGDARRGGESSALPLRHSTSAPDFIGGGRGDWDAQTVCDWLLQMMKTKEEAASRAERAEAQAQAAAHIAKVNAIEATSHAARTQALMNVMVAAQTADEARTTAAIIEAVKVGQPAGYSPGRVSMVNPIRSIWICGAETRCSCCNRN